jgi:DNA (cytosine-5)-methyltransferase 1
VTLRIVDLFAGAGGMSVGFEEAGGRVILAVEQDKRACQTYAQNHKSAIVLNETIDSNWSVVDRLKEHLDDPTCDLLIGGPPCQGWSTLGPRASAERRDRLNASVEHFVDQVRLLAPPAIVMENVRGLAVKDGGRHLDRVVRRLRRLKYRVHVHDVRAVDFGVPQLRHRVFVVATQGELNIKIDIKPTMTPGSWATVWDAIGDLPSIPAGGASNVYLPAKTSLQRELRSGASTLTWHEAPAHRGRTLDVLRALGGEGSSRSAIENEIKLTSGFHNTYCRLWSDKPAPAVTSSAGRVSSGRNAHPFDDRALTPREAARLQTFPDTYQWVGERWPLYEQIGNAVPPLLAKAVAKPVLDSLDRGLRL